MAAADNRPGGKNMHRRLGAAAARLARLLAHKGRVPAKAAAAAPVRQAEMAVEAATGNLDTGRLGWGIAFLVTGTFMFALQDAATKSLVSSYPISFIIMTRCFALFIGSFLLLSASPGGIKANIKTKKPVLQFLRGALVMSQWLLAAYSMRELGLGETTALYEAYPLFCTILAVFILHETIGWRRIVGLIIGFCGILIMVRPGFGAVSLGTLCALSGALLFAFYVVLTRLVANYDQPQTSFFYMGSVSAALMLPALPFIWTQIAWGDIWLFAALGLFCVSAHFCMIKALSLASVAVLQPFNYSQLIWSILIGFIVFGDVPDKYVFIGAGLVVFSGLFVIFRGHMRKPRIFVE
ncbi:MAG: DMT family transporter [Candidatus Tokpelaia sp.]|uniref:DMT family transporter n=1 Tax=Candidatus Tokpelaia sp. TaxID=2233777 RepID=UPI001239B4A6|nr:DMT family transporter [Candidatus Tokpelaia sp.]KAA6204778.1 MAG: DMT family transporter [Candidatus Tokpelaia sp.]KAA6206581.1 MAG: DMT family transporter [Candidatus Tokpelaia sp.]KAA6405879.1 EamA/RhaT family transporter [Candidatus Tokpelaia sp.]